MDWLPSDLRWISAAAEDLLDGTLMHVRGLPRSGKTQLCKAIAEQLGPSAIYVDGRGFTESNQSERLEELLARLESTVVEHGCAQLLFDNYGRALRRSRGGALHSALYSVLVDGPNAPDIGAMLVARFSESIDLGFAGSPLLSRSSVRELPELSSDDAAKVGISWARLEGAIGHSASFGRRFGCKGTDLEYVTEEYLSIDCAHLLDDLPLGAVEALLGARDAATLDGLSRQALVGLGVLIQNGELVVPTAVFRSGILEEMEVRNPGWPGTFEESVAKFVELLAGMNDALWIDRYHLVDVGRLLRFIKDVRKDTDARMQILTCDLAEFPGARGRLKDELSAVSGVEVKIMAAGDRKALHERQLVFPRHGYGYALPPVNIVLCVDSPGSAVVTRIPRLSVTYSHYWNRATGL